MRAAQAFSTAFRTVSGNPLRSALTMLGIVIGVASVVTVLAIGSGAQGEVAEQIRAVGADVLMINPGTLQHAGARMKAGSRPTLTKADADAIATELPEVRAAAGSLAGSAQVIRENLNWNTTINGTTAAHFLVRDWAMAAGRPFTPGEEEASGKVVVLGDTVARELFRGEPAVDAEVRIMDVPFVVVGVLRPKGEDQDDVAFVPLSTAKLRFLGSASAANRDAVAYVVAKAASDEAVPEAERSIAGLLRQRHHLGSEQEDDFRVTNPAAVMAAQRSTTRTIAVLLAAVASVSLLVGGISIMNMMIVSVAERTAEIGIRRAIGARSRDILVQFLAEALVLCTGGGLLGVAAGVAASWAIAAVTGWPVAVEPGAVLLAVGSATATGLFFGFYPARRAARLDPIAALRAE